MEWHSALSTSLFVLSGALVSVVRNVKKRENQGKHDSPAVSKLTPGLLLEAYRVNKRFGILSTDEVNLAREIVIKLRSSEDLVFSAVDFNEPTKEEMMAALPKAAARCARVTSMRVATNEVFVDIVDLEKNKVIKETTFTDRQPCISPNEYELVESMCREYKPLVNFLESKGLEPDCLRVDPWCVGYYNDTTDNPGERMALPLLYYHDVKAGDEIPYCRPLEGIRLRISLTKGKVVFFDTTDTSKFPLPLPANKLPNASYTPEKQQRKDVKPLEITQPDGPSFTVVDSNRVAWQGFEFQVGWNAREGLSLNLMTLQGRLVFHKLAVVEMVVPYGDPRTPHCYKAAFDAGEDGFGRNANSLKLGCDCLGHIEYLPGVMTDEDGAHVLENAVCIHEEDCGIAWKHTDWRTGEAQVRRGRRLVVSYITTIANYDYGFYWHLYQDGKVELEVKLTGVLSTGLYSYDDDGNRAYGASLGNHLYAPIHQHFFCARIDPVVDGPQNVCVESNVVAGPVPGSGDVDFLGNAYYYTHRRLESEADAARDCDVSKQRTWCIESAHAKNFTGKPTAYSLVPAPACTPFGDTGTLAKQLGRAAFLKHALWVTRCDEDERYPGGDFPNQRNALDGLPLWARQDRGLVDDDLVLWHTFGVTHQPRLEDFPVMPVEHTGFHLKPRNFFPQSPVMDLPSARGQANNCCKNDE